MINNLGDVLIVCHVSWGYTNSMFLLCEVIELYLSFSGYIPIGCLLAENIQ
jgi:hypothetical protein